MDRKEELKVLINHCKNRIAHYSSLKDDCDWSEEIIRWAKILEEYNKEVENIKQEN